MAPLVVTPDSRVIRPETDGGGVDNEIAGDVLVHLDHEALKDLDVTSVGHRLYLLKQIYNLKIAHGVKFEKDDYVPICIGPWAN
jgi:SAM domain (Sterile alpha motif)